MLLEESLVMSNGSGLKQQWGVGDPAKAGSDKQSQQVQASFQKEMGAINAHLQYTSANAEAARHDPLEARRDALYPAFQAALAQIDRTDPAKAQGAIDKVLADAKALSAETAALHKAAEKALNDWKARQPKFDAAVHQVEEMEAWGYDKVTPLRGLIDGIRTQTNERRYAQASLTVDQLLPKLTPLNDDFQKQKAAKPKYEQALAEQSARLDALKAAERPSQAMTAKAGEADTALTDARAKADAKDFVAASEKMKAVQASVDALDKLAKDPQRVKFLADRKAAEEAVNAPHDTSFPELEADWNAIVQLKNQSDPLADSGDYAGANKILADVKTKITAYQKKLEKLKQKKEYEDGLTTLGPKFTEAAQYSYKPLQPKLDDINKRKAAMEAAAAKEDYATALKMQSELQAKLDAFLADLKKLQQAEQDYNTTRAAVKPKLDDALVSARVFTSLQSARAALVQANAAVEAAAAAQDFENALQLIKALQTKVDAYLDQANKQQEKYTKKADEIAKQLDAASDLTRGDVAKAAANALTDDELQHLPTPIRNRLLAEMQKGGLTDDKKAACKKLFSKKFLDPEFEKIDKENQQKMIDKMKNDPAFKEARKNWNKMSEADRIAVLQKAVDYQAEAYGVPKTTIETYSKNDATDYGYYNHADGKLHINANDAALKNGGFDEALDTAVHENGHRYQATLIDKLDATPPEIKPGDPLYDQAMTFKLNDTTRGFYVQPPEKTPSPNTGNEYFTQPQENHSRITGRAVKNAHIGK
jgi:hypothetical protein